MHDTYPRLLTGLGNPGLDYQYTRHNIGFMIIDHYVNQISNSSLLQFESKNSKIWQFKVRGRVIYLQKPMTFMNLSGKPVYQFCLDKNISPEELLVIYDDADLPLGRIRLRQKGSSGGHRGIESIINAFNSEHFNRLRIGIGRNRIDMANYVLTAFLDEERDIVDNVIKGAVQALSLALIRGIPLAMNQYNGLSLAK